MKKNMSVRIRALSLILAPSVFVILGFLIYANAFHFPFVFDDVAFIVKSPYLHMEEVTLASLRNVLKDPMAYRPLTMLSFALNYYFGRHDVVGYHAVNVVIHVTAGILLFFFLTITLELSRERTSGGSSRPRPRAPALAAFFAALLWFSSPLCTQAVTFVFQRGQSMASMFYLASLLFYAKGRSAQRAKNKRYYWHFVGCAGAGLLAMLSKAIAATLPLYIFLYEWYFFQGLDKNWMRRHAVWILYGLIPALTYGVVHFLMGTHNDQSKLYRHAIYTLGEHLLTETRVVFYYLSLIVYPHPSRMIFDHGFAVSRSLTDPVTTLISICAIAGSIWAAFAFAKKAPLVSFGILWYFGQMVIEAVVPFDLAWDYRTYLSSMFINLLAVLLVFRAVPHTKTVAAGLCVAAAVLCFWTYQRNKVYSDPVTLWADTVEKAPDNARAHNNFAREIWKQGRAKETRTHLREALRINPKYADAHNNMGNVLRSKGRIEEAVRHYEEALRFDPDHLHARLNLENTAVRARFEAMFKEALAADPGDGDAHYHLGLIMAQRGMFDEAVYHFTEALKIDPDALDARNNLAVMYMEQGRFEEAAGQFQEVLKLDPGYPNARTGLNIALEKLEKKTK